MKRLNSIRILKLRGYSNSHNISSFTKQQNINIPILFSVGKNGSFKNESFFSKIYKLSECIKNDIIETRYFNDTRIKFITKWNCYIGLDEDSIYLRTIPLASKRIRSIKKISKAK